MNLRSLIIIFVAASLGACGALERGAAPPADVVDAGTNPGLDVDLGDGSDDPDGAPEDAPVTGLSFAEDGVHDALTASCAGSGCHGGAGGGEYTLSGDASADYSATVNVVTPGDAASSRLLRKASNEISHGGGPVLLPGDDAYDLIAAWINGGANP